MNDKKKYDNTNKGALFDDAQSKLYRSGNLNINGTDMEAAVVQKKTKKGKTVFEIYQKIGALFIETREEKKYNASGDIVFEGQEHSVFAYKNVSEKGVHYTRLQVHERDENYQAQNNQPSKSNPKPDTMTEEKDDEELDQDIPF